jgi:uncharacterized protein
MNNSFTDWINSSIVRISVIGVLAILALFLLAHTIALAANFGRATTPATDTITISASGQAMAAPDVARITFTVMHTSPTVAEAQEKTTVQANEAIAYVKSEGVADKDVKTLAYNIYPQYSYPNPCQPGTVCPAYTGTPKITGYQVSQTIQVTVRDLDKTGPLLGGLGSKGVQNLDGPSLGLDDPTAGYNAARADAIAKAKSQAQVLADQLGVRLGKIINFNESSGGYPYPVAYDMAYGRGGGVESKVANPSIPTGENQYSATVTITYEIR